MIEMIIEGRDALIADGVHVRRILPYRMRRMVGPFTFLDEMGPTTFGPGGVGDVLPHPHIGLATVTYLFEGTINHRDSLGSVQVINPGDLNWMSAGKGVVHSERLPGEFRAKGGRMHGLQAWVALPLASEDSEPSFQHFGKDELPSFPIDRGSIRLVAGAAFGHKSPVKTESKLFYFEITLSSNCSWQFDPEGQEAALYLVQGTIAIGEIQVEGPRLIVFKTGAKIALTSLTNAHGIVFGGEPIEGERFIWWNFVSSSRQKIEDAKERWRQQKFPKVPGETEFVPLPESNVGSTQKN